MCELLHHCLGGHACAQTSVSVAGDVTPTRTPLYAACRLGHVEVVQELFEAAHLDVNLVSAHHESPFFAACEAGHIELVDLLLRRVDVDTNIADVGQPRLICVY